MKHSLTPLFVALTTYMYLLFPRKEVAINRLRAPFPILFAILLMPDLVSAGGWIEWPINEGGNGHFYRLTDVIASWADAEAEAQARGGHLATINDAAENQWVFETFAQGQKLWLGLYQDLEDPDYFEPNGAWKWISGEPLIYTNWISGEPNDNGGEHWAQMKGSNSAWPGQWNDLGPNSMMPGVIEVFLLPPTPPFLQIETPAIDLELVQGQQVTITWLDDAQAGAEIRLYFDPDRGSTPWDEGGNNEITIPFSIDASSPVNELTWYVSNLDPGTYSIWGKSDNGVHEPAYSRAPGLVLVTEFTEDTEPEGDGRIDLDTIPGLSYAKGGQGNNADHLYLVTHGWNGLLGHFNNHAWIEETANYVAAQPIADQWDVAFLNWGLLAGEGNPLEIPIVLARAAVVGIVLAELIEANGYTHIEVVAHSAGSWMAHTISKHYFMDIEVNVNLTLLDAVVVWPLTSTVLGQFADHTANFYDKGNTPYTHSDLASAFNANISCRRNEYINDYPPGGFFADHSTPWKWYRKSAESYRSYFEDDDTYIYDGDDLPHPLGFKMSKAYDSGKQWDLSAYPNDGSDASLFKLECGEPFTGGGECTNNTSIFVLHSDTFDFTAMQSAVGDDGTVTIAPDNLELTTGVETAWVGFDVPVDHAISAVLFDVEFTSADPDAEGYATGYWVGAQLSGADERFADENTPATSSFLFFETIPPGERVISYRLDANGGPTSSVRISNLRIGMFIEGDVNGDCVLSVDDFCAWVANPFDLDGNGVIDDQDQTLLAMALGVSEADENNNGIPDVCDCIGDLDNSGDVGVNDLLMLLGTWGDCPKKGDCPADFDNTGDVGVSDLLVLLGNWGLCP